MSRRHVFLTTTATVEGRPVEQYQGIVTAHLVAGTGFVSDLFAAFSDTFGGRSKAYQQQLEALNRDVLEALREQAAARHANGVVGVRVDYDEVSGKNTQMFMVTATGTAVTLSAAGGDALDQERRWVASEDLVAAINVDHEREQIKAGKFKLTREALASLASAQDGQVAAEVLRAFVVSVQQDGGVGGADGPIRHYLEAIPQEEATVALYGAMAHSGTQGHIAGVLFEMGKALGLVDYGLLAERLPAAPPNLRPHLFKFARLMPAVLVPEDADDMEALATVIEGIPADVPLEEKRGMLGSKKYWRCANCGVENAETNDACQCNHDRRGLPAGDVAGVLHRLRNRARVLRTL